MPRAMCAMIAAVWRGVAAQCQPAGCVGIVNTEPNLVVLQATRNLAYKWGSHTERAASSTGKGSVLAGQEFVACVYCVSE